MLYVVVMHPNSMDFAEDRAPALRISKGPGLHTSPFIFTSSPFPRS